MVDVLLIIEASDDTIAATRAAKARPLTPTGTKFFNNHGYASSDLPISPIESIGFTLPTASYSVK